MTDTVDDNSSVSPSVLAGDGTLEPQIRTFLIADVRGYSTFTRERGDAAAALLAKRFADLSRDAVEARSGRVIELRGDEAFAVFGSTAQAVRAAVELQATFGEESLIDPAFQLPVGIGIDAGEAVPVEDGYRGVAVNMAARLCSSAAAGQVLVTRTVTDLAGSFDDLVFAERGRSSFKGFEEPVEVIEALAVARPGPGILALAPEAAHRRAGEGLPPELDPLTPLVDREAEMRWLRGTWRQIERGRGRIIFLSGPAQIGKTRLAAEIAAHVHERGAPVRYAGPGGAATALALAAVKEAMSPEAPSLVVLDDVDVAGPSVAQALSESFEHVGVLPVLVLGVLRDPEASPQLAELVERADERGDGHRVLPPFDLEGVRGIVRLYAGDQLTEAPVESMARASKGIPGRVHEVASDWARSEASRRLAAAAEFLSAGRDRHASDLEFANNAIALKLGSLYTIAGRDVALAETCPYKGLAQFDADDAAYFFGRERLVGELAARTVQAGILGVVGASGSGKSSAIAAGLVPSLKAGLLPGSDRWRQVSLRPGEHPMDELRRVLSIDAPDPLEAVIGDLDGDGRLVLVVDQFEETFTACATEEERATFIAALSRAGGSPERVVVVVAIRGDHYAHLAPYPDLAALLTPNHVLVGSMTREELRRAIELPARRVGLRIESALVDALVEEVADEPGGLPLLSTAMVELWETRENGWIRMEAYERTGGVRGAVARLAESSYAELSDREQDATRRVFLRLVAAGEGDAVTRRRVPLEELDLDRDGAAAGALARLTRDRLLTTGEGTVEVAHEALLREWPRLQGWLEEDAQDRQLRQNLAQTSRQWRLGGHEPSELYRGARLSAALDWSVEHAGELNEQERDFLGASREASEREAERQRRTNRRLRGLLVGVAVFLAIALVAGSLAAVQRGRARDSASAAERSAVVAEAQRLDAQSLVEKSPDLSMLLARQALALNDDPQTESALFTTLLRWTGIVRVIRPNGNRLLGIAAGPTGDWLAISDNDHSLFIYDLRTYAVLHVIDRSVDGMVASPDGRTLFVASPAPGGGKVVPPEVVEAFDVSTGKVLWRTTAGGGGTSGFALSPDGHSLGLADNPSINNSTGGKPSGKPGSLTLLRPSNGARVGDAIPLGKFRGLAFLDPDHVVTTHGPDRPGVKVKGEIVDLRSGRVAQLAGLTSTFAVSADGSTIAAAQPTGDVRLIDLRSGSHRLLRAPQTIEPNAPDFSPDGKTVAETGGHGEVFTWDVASGVARQHEGQTGAVIGMAFSSDGRTLYTDGLDGSAVVWDLAGDRSIQRSFRIPQRAEWFPYVAFASDHLIAVTMTSDHRTHFLDAASLKEIGSLPEGSVECCMPPAFDAQGDRMATVSGIGVDLWSVADRLLIRHLYTSPLPPDQAPVDANAMSPDGTIVAANDNDTVLLIDANTGQIERRLDPGWYVAVLAFSPNGDLLAAEGGNPSGPQYSEVWDVHTGKELWREKVPNQWSLSSFSTDSGLLAVGTSNGDVHVFDAQTGRPVGEPFVTVAGFVNSVAFDPASNLLASTGTDGVVTLSDPTTGARFGDPLAGAADWSTGAWSPDGSEYVLLARDGSGHLWHVSLQDWEARACQTAGRTLSQTEWQQFLPARPYQPVCAAATGG